MKLSNKIRIISITLVVFLILLFVLIIITNQLKTPKVNVKVELSQITNEESSVLFKTDNISIDNVKKLYLEVEITDSPKCKVRDVNIPDLNLIDRIDYVRSYKANYREENRLKSSKAFFTKEYIFNSTELSIAELKEIFQEEKITISIVTNINKEFYYSYSIGELLEASPDK